VDALLSNDLVEFILNNANDERVTREAILTYFALKAYLSNVHRSGDIRDHWKDAPPDPLGMYPRQNLSQFMTRDLFELIDYQGMGSRTENDIYRSSRTLLEHVGQAARNCIVAGLGLVLDESMCWFYGHETESRVFEQGGFEPESNPRRRIRSRASLGR
jgi:hypothetical protein